MHDFVKRKTLTTDEISDSLGVSSACAIAFEESGGELEHVTARYEGSEISGFIVSIAEMRSGPGLEPFFATPVKASEFILKFLSIVKCVEDYASGDDNGARLASFISSIPEIQRQFENESGAFYQILKDGI